MVKRTDTIAAPRSDASPIEDVPTPPVSLRLFGPFHAAVGEEALPRLRSRRGQWLLALLALHPGRPVERSWLAGTLWPDSTEENALVSLRQTLVDLRRALGPHAHCLLSSTSRTLMLDLQNMAVDVLAFDAAIKRGDSASLEQAAALHAKPLLEDCHEEWVLLEREAREQALLGALQTLAADAAAREDWPGAALLLRRVAAHDPFRETAQRDLMQALAQAGDPAAAIWVYRDLRLLLRREMNSEPAPETQALFQQIRERARRPMPSAPASTLAPTVTAPAVPKATPARGYLPRPLSELIGRERDVEEVGRRLFRARLVSLTGMGGVGKTRLAIRVAEVWADDQPEGIWFVDLAPLSDPALVPRAVATTLGVLEEAGRSLTETLASALQPSRLLLILDNCEHLLDACAELAAFLLLHCPHLRVLATSRQALGITGETTWPVSPLSLPDFESGPPLEAVSQSESARLFVERVQAVAPDFALSTENALVVGQICRRLDGIPLALELAAARVKVLSLEQVGSRLDDRFRLLSQGSRTALPRQQTLRALIDWSYDLLSGDERALLVRLSVFAGGWTLAAAQAVCGDGDVLDTLCSLAEQSLVVIEAGEGPERRYRLLETIREYAAERLRASREADEVRQRHRDYFRALVDAADAPLRGPEQLLWLDRLEADHDNLRAALEGCRRAEAGSAPPGSLSAGLQIANRLRVFWQTRGYSREGRQWLESLLAAGGGTVPQRARALSNMGLLALSLAEGDVARGLFEQGLALFREAGDARGTGDVLNNLGIVAWWQDDYERARALYEESLALDRQLGDAYSMAGVLSNLGLVAQCQADYGQARAYLEESLVLRRSVGDWRGVANSLLNLGVVAADVGEDGTTQTYLEESLRQYRELGQRDGIAICLDYLGRLWTRMGHLERAETQLREALAIQRDLGDARRVADVLSSQSELAHRQGDLPRAWSLRRDQVAMRQAMGERRLLAGALESTAALAAQKHPHEAARLYGAVAALRVASGCPPPPAEQAEYARILDGLRDALSVAGFEAAWSAGQAMTPGQAVALALDESLGPP